MIQLSDVQKQLLAVGYRPRAFQRAEVKELCRVLHDGEQVISAVNGNYEGGFALLVATDSRLILVDRKPMFLTLDSIVYSMIQELSLNYRLFNSTIHIYTSSKCLNFNTWSHAHLREMFAYAQKRTLQFRFIDTHPSSNMPAQDFMPEFTQNIPNSPAPQLSEDVTLLPQPEPELNVESQEPKVSNEPQQPDYTPPELQDIPVMPVPARVHHLSRTSLIISLSKIATLGLWDAHQVDNRLSPYKLPTLSQKRFAKYMS